MRYALGVDVGTSFTAAAVCRWDEQNKTEAVALGSRMPSVPSVLFLGADGSVVVGEGAERRTLTDPDRVVREFKRRIGDDTPLFVGGRPYAAPDLSAMMVRWVVDRVTEREGGPPDRIAITHPAGWGPHKKDLLSRALGAVGLANLTFIAEPEAAAVSYAAQERVEADTTIAVYDLGGGTFDAAVVRKTGASSFTLLGPASGLEHLGGADFDEVVFDHVQARLAAHSDPAQPDSTPWDALDIEDPSVLSGLARLRRECTEAKEVLSADTEVSIPVLLPGVSAQVRLVRSEFEEMIRPALEDTVDALSRALRSADLSSADLGAVLLVGGSSRIPLVTQLVSAALSCSVVVDADPKTTIALGAALSLAPQPQPVGATGAVATPAANPDSEPLHRLGQAPDRPPMVPTPRAHLGDQESTEDDPALRRGIMTRRLRNVVGAGVLSCALLIALAVAVSEDSLRSVPGGGPSDAAPAGVTPPAVAIGDSGAPAETPNATAPHVADSAKKATKVAQTTSAKPKTATSTAGRSAAVSPDTQRGQVTNPVPPPPSNPPTPNGDDTTDGNPGGGDTGGSTGGGNTDGSTGGGDTTPPTDPPPSPATTA